MDGQVWMKLARPGGRKSKLVPDSEPNSRSELRDKQILMATCSELGVKRYTIFPIRFDSMFGLLSTCSNNKYLKWNKKPALELESL